MATSTISRSTMTDDDGSGTTGTILNNAWLQDIYARIDALFSASFEVSGKLVGDLNLRAVVSKTIGTGAITATQNFHTVDTEAAAATDDLDTVTASATQSEGSVLVLMCANTAHAVTVKDGTGNILLDRGDCLLNTTKHILILIRKGSNWVEVARSGGLNTVAVTGTYTALTTDDVICVTSGTFTITLHAASGKRGNRPLVITNQGSGVVTVSRAGSDTIVGANSFTLAQYNSVILLTPPAGTTWFIT